MPRLRPSRRSALIASGLLLVLLAAPFVLTWRVWRQEKLNQALYVAVKTNNSPSVRSLLRAGADANSSLSTSSPNLSEFLLAQWHKKTTSGVHGAALLCVALDTPVPSYWHSHMPIWYPPDSALVVQSLIGAGANVEVANGQGEKPLLLAVRHRHSQATVSALLRAGADVNTQDQGGWTPLIWAAYESEPKTVHLLLAHHANPNRGARQEYARNALSVASHPAIIKMLKQAGATE